MDFNKMVEFFVTKPKYLTRSSSKFVRGQLGGAIFRGSQSDDIIKAKSLARERLAGSSTVSESDPPAIDNTTKHSFSDGNYEISGKSHTPITSLEELIEFYKIDTEKWEVVSWECNIWEVGRKAKSSTVKVVDGVRNEESNDTGKMYVQPLHQVKAKLRPLKDNKEAFFFSNFTKFLENYKPAAHISKPVPQSKKEVTSTSSLIIPKQDAHYNKYDIYGSNDIHRRFSILTDVIMDKVRKACLISDLDEIVYVVGSDQFNSEWTSATTKGTPQTNIMSYEAGFSLSCDHEIALLTNMLTYSNRIRVVYVPGNHDHFVGWHFVTFLQAYFRNEPRISFDTSTLCTKLYTYGNSAVLLNHGDAIPFKDLASTFSRDYRHVWATCKFFYVLTGDKHSEHSKDFSGVRIHQVPQLSGATSSWDDKKGYIAFPEVQCFLLESDKGNTSIFKQTLYL